MVTKEILNQLEEGIVLFNKASQIIMANRAFLQKTGYDQLEHFNIEDILWDSKEKEKCFVLEEKDLAFKSSTYKKISVKANCFIEEEAGQKIYWLIIKKWCDELSDLEVLNVILDFVPHNIWIESLDGYYLYANQVAVDEIYNRLKWDLTKESIVGAPIRTLWGKFFDEDRWQYDRIQILSNKAINQYNYLKSDGGHNPYFITKIPLKNQNEEIKGIICLEDNGAQRKYVEERFLEAYRKWNQNADDSDRIPNRLPLDINYCLGVSSMMFLVYTEDEGKLNCISYLDKEELDITEYKDIYIGLQTARECLSKQMIWRNKGAIDENTWINLAPLFTEQVQCIVQYPIMYKEQLIGVIIATYKDEYGLNLLNQREMGILCNNLALTINNIRLLEKVNKEFVLREKAEIQLQDLFGTTMGLYSVYDLLKKEHTINLGWNELLGWNKYEIKNNYSYIYEVDREDVESRITRVIKEGAIEEAVSRFNCKDGSYKWIKWKAKRSANMREIVMYGIDVTNEIQMVDERNAFQKALELEVGKTEFLANMSHELRTPLNMIYSISQLIEEEVKENTIQNGLPEEVAKNLLKHRRIIKQNIFRLLRLINNIIDISKMGAGTFTPKLQPCNIVEVIEDITMSVAEYIKGNNLSILFDTEEEEIETACDIESMERVMLNLLSNAVKYSKKTGHIMVNILKQKDYVTIEVSDDGIGIAKENQKLIFERFAQVDKSLTRKREGSGIGLSLVKSLLEIQGGSISVESELGKGSTFRIRLPIQKIEEKPLQEKQIEEWKSHSRIERCIIEFSDIYNLY